MVATATSKRSKKLSSEAIAEIVMQLLGELLGEEVEVLRKRLLENGPTMPVDSLDLLDVLAEFRKITGLQVPLRKLQRHTLRSIKSFSEFVAKEGQT
jgi:acyl carrier protein